MRSFLPLLVVASTLLASCAIHPLPEDVSGVPTHIIVRQIRCEAREAARELILDEFKQKADSHDAVIAARARELLLVYDGDENVENIAKFDPNKEFADYPTIKTYLNLIYGTAIAYDFDLTMTETNNIGGGVGVLGSWAPKLALSVGADYNRDRANERKFTDTDTLGDLLKNLSHPRQDQHYCDARVVEDNIAYPITGRIGIGKTLKDFYRVAVFDGLKVAKGQTPAPWADQLTFTTTIDATLSSSPLIAFNAVAGALQASSLTLNATAKRTDKHQVTLGISLPTGQAVSELTSLTNFVFARTEPSPGGPAARRLVSAPFVGNSIIAHPANAAEAQAAYAVDLVKSREVVLVPAP